MDPTIYRPYLVIPKLIVQPTWGGNKIVEFKNWNNNAHISNLKIGQSYELFGGSKLSLFETDSNSIGFLPEIGNPDDATVLTEFELKKHSFVELKDLIAQDPVGILGQKVVVRHNGLMPLLNKINHSLGNSFQIHIKSGVSHPRWSPKPESWYYLQDGLVTFGLKQGIMLEDFKSACQSIEVKMKDLSEKVRTNTLKIDEARIIAQKFITLINPRQYVNLCEIKKHSLLDLSAGGIHHSWEEDNKNFPEGNFLYEVQHDVMDPVSTIRCFDQGKIKNDGHIREIHIDDYFKYIDTSIKSNDLANAIKTSNDGQTLLQTPFYQIESLRLDDTLTQKCIDSFCHYFVSDGAVRVSTKDVSLIVRRGHSVFLPQRVDTYLLEPLVANTELIETSL